MTRVLITGATGGLGRNAVARALADGWRVCATGRRGGVLQQLADQGARTYQADLVSMPDQVLYEMMDLKDVVWHCAALAAPWGAREDFMAANVEMPARLFEAAARARVRTFVHISSPALYFDFQHRLNVPESHRAAKFASFYAESKALGEDRLQELALQFPRTRLVILRPRVIFGPHDQVLFPRVLEAIARFGGRLLLPNGGTAVADMVYVENVVEAMVQASKADLASGSVFNLSNGETIELREAISCFLKAQGRDVQVCSAPYSLLKGVAAIDERLSTWAKREPTFTRHTLGGMAFDMTLDISAARQALNYRPVVSLHDGLQKTAAWFSAKEQSL